MPRVKKAPHVPTDRLDDMLMRLKLSSIRDQLDSLLDEDAHSDEVGRGFRGKAATHSN